MNAGSSAEVKNSSLQVNLDFLLDEIQATYLIQTLSMSISIIKCIHVILLLDNSPVPSIPSV